MKNWVKWLFLCLWIVFLGIHGPVLESVCFGAGDLEILNRVDGGSMYLRFMYGADAVLHHPFDHLPTPPVPILMHLKVCGADPLASS